MNYSSFSALLFLFIATFCTGQDDNFFYKNISEDWVENFSSGEIHDLFSDWIITEIAEVGGSSISEERIHDQIGKRVRLTPSKFMTDLWRYREIVNPSYSLESIRATEGTKLRGTSFFYGYRPCRKHVFNLVVTGNGDQVFYFEIINLKEMVSYYDGRLYFLSRK